MTLQSSTAGAEVRASLFVIARSAPGLRANAEDAGDEPSQPLAAELPERPEQLGDVPWYQGCAASKAGGPAPLPPHPVPG